MVVVEKTVEAVVVVAKDEVEDEEEEETLLDENGKEDLGERGDDWMSNCFLILIFPNEDNVNDEDDVDVEDDNDDDRDEAFITLAAWIAMALSRSQCCWSSCSCC